MVFVEEEVNLVNLMETQRRDCASESMYFFFLKNSVFIIQH